LVGSKFVIHSRWRAYLAIVLVATAALWSGVAGIRLNSDDYQYLASLAPIQHFGDVLRPFVSHDANPSFFRPVANATMALDFMLFGWSGAAFHLTNLFFHLIATLLVFYFVRDIFALTERESLWAALLFGMMASHEYNLVVDTARADMLAAVFVMLTFILQKRGYRIAALASFALSLLSKEIAIMALPLLPLIFWKKSGDKTQRVRRSIMLTTPYLIIAVAFYFYHAHFTESVLTSQPLTSEGAHSLAVFLRNGAYSIGYLILPLDLASATAILMHYHALAITVGVVLCIAVIGLVIRNRDKAFLACLLQPVAFTFVTGIVLCLTFERWRLYLPSVGAAAIIVLMVSRTSSRTIRTVLFVAMLALGAFHIYRALGAESEWRASTALRDMLQENVTSILSTIPERPVTLGMLDVPAKLGSAAVDELGQSALVTRAEADRISERNHETGTTDSVHVDSWTAVNVYALNASEGFRGLELQQIADKRYLISVPESSTIALYPATASDGIARRDVAFQSGDTISEPEFVDIIRSSSFGIPKSIEVRVRDTSATLLSITNAGTFERIR
jgi:hypothetical protein